MIKLTQKYVQEQMQYWYSKYCNSIMRDEREIYLNLYKSYVELNDYYRRYNEYIPEQQKHI